MLVKMLVKMLAKTQAQKFNWKTCVLTPHTPPQLQAACSFRGDVTLELKDGSAIEGYVFDLKRTNASPHAVRILPKDGRARMTVEQSTIQTLCFTGKDAAAGKTWENWMRRYAQMKLQGEVAGIESETLE